MKKIKIACKFIVLFVLLLLLAITIKMSIDTLSKVCIYSVIIMTFLCIIESFITKHILFCKTRDEAKIPSRKIGNAGFDIYGLLPEDNTNGYVTILPHETIMLPTGIKSVIPENYYIQIQERGSTGHKGIKYSAGVIDSNYRGEWFLGITNVNDKCVVFYEDTEKYASASIAHSVMSDKYGEGNYILYPLSKAIFQGVLHKTHDSITAKEVDIKKFDKYETDRGDGKLGSSGK